MYSLTFRIHIMLP